MSPPSSLETFLNSTFLAEYAEYDDRWRECGNLQEVAVLRLSILRDLIQRLHAEASRLLATAGREDAELLHQLRPRLEALRSGTLRHPTLKAALLDARPAAEKPQRSLPPSLLSLIGPEKIQRFDRKWEAEIAAEAAALGWEFWSLTAEIEIDSAQAFHEALNVNTWPEGVVLFVEPSEPARAGSRRWRGRWLITLKPDPERAFGRFTRNQRVTEAPDWNKVFPQS